MESLVQVGKTMPGATIQEHFVPLVKRLAAGDFFTSRISAAGLFATIYPSTPPPIRPALRKQYEQLAKDDMPMVRSAAFAHMPALAEALEKDVLISELSPLFNELSSDVQESVREMAVGNVVKMVKFMSPEEASRLFGTFFDNIRMLPRPISRRGRDRHEYLVYALCLQCCRQMEVSYSVTCTHAVSWGNANDFMSAVSSFRAVVFGRGTAFFSFDASVSANS